MQELSDLAVSASARAMEEPSSGSEAPSEASEVVSDDQIGYGTSGDDSDEEQVAGCESCGESDYEDALSEADDEAAADGDAANNMEDGGQNGDRPACSMCFVPLDLSKLVTAKDEEVLTCDGSCGRDMPWQELRFYCVTDCDFDMCTACAGIKRRERFVAQPASPSPRPPPAPLPSTPLQPRAPQSPSPFPSLAQPPQSTSGQSIPRSQLPQNVAGAPPEAEVNAEAAPTIAIAAAPPRTSSSKTGLSSRGLMLTLRWRPCTVRLASICIAHMLLRVLGIWGGAFESKFLIAWWPRSDQDIASLDACALLMRLCLAGAATLGSRRRK